jgi:hypothetical protein
VPAVCPDRKVIEVNRGHSRTCILILTLQRASPDNHTYDLCKQLVTAPTASLRARCEQDDRSIFTGSEPCLF